MRITARQIAFPTAIHFVHTRSENRSSSHELKNWYAARPFHSIPNDTTHPPARALSPIAHDAARTATSLTRARIPDEPAGRSPARSRWFRCRDLAPPDAHRVQAIVAHRRSAQLKRPRTKRHDSLCCEYLAFDRLSKGTIATLVRTSPRSGSGDDRRVP